MSGDTHLTHYSVPKRFQNANAAEMLFWDAIYYSLAVHGEKYGRCGRAVELTLTKLNKLTGLSTPGLSKLKGHLYGADHDFFEEEGVIQHSFRLISPSYYQDIKKHCVKKPIGLIEQGWLRTLFQEQKSRFPIAILNRFLMRTQRTSCISFDELHKRCKRPDKRQLPNRADIERALSLLMSFGLVESSADDHYTFHASHLAHKPQKIDAESRDSLPLSVLTLRETDQERYEKVLELLAVGNFNKPIHAEEIARDLRFVRNEEEYKLLVALSKKHHHRICSKTKWNNLWKLYCRNRLQQSKLRKGQVYYIDLFTKTCHRIQMALPSLESCGLRFAKLVIWVNDPDAMLDMSEGVTLNLLTNNISLWNRVLHGEVHVIRHDITSSLKGKKQLPLTLNVQSGTHLPQVHIKANLEARCFI